MVTISDQAVDKIKEMLAAEENPQATFLRVGVRSGGCSGFSYSLGFDQEQHDLDKVFDISGMRVIVDEESSKYLYGVQIGYRETGMGGGFTIDNPNAFATCGCGSSFRTKEEAGEVKKCD